jgi:lysozyme
MIINPKVIDLYHGNSVTSFAKAYESGIRGVIHKATEGATVVDRQYSDRYEQAIEAGLLWGAYHFIRPGNMKQQAQSFVDMAEPDDATLMALDHEDPQVLLVSAKQFVQAVEKLIGRKVVLYSGFLIKQQITRASNEEDMAFWGARRLWLAQYGPKPTTPKPWTAPWLWQYTGDGNGPEPHSVPGIQPNCDISSYAGTDEQLAAEWVGAKITP